jgi:hypothetical protein
MSVNPDRLYELLPAIHRQRDEQQGYPLQALLRVIGEQVQLLEDDIERLYENSFIETCDDWAVPYIGDLIGYRPLNEAGTNDGGSPARQRVLIPRREVADTLAWRRRKGTLALLEVLAEQVAGWPARAVEFQRLLAWTQHLNHQHRQRGRTVDLRHCRALDALDGPFDQLAHTVDVRRVPSGRSLGRYNIASVGLFLFRLRAYPVTRTPAYCHEGLGARCYSFSVLGNDAPLFIRPRAEDEPTDIAQPANLPQPIRRRWLGGHGQQGIGPLYGAGLSFTISAPDWPKRGAAQPIPKELIVPADLSDWRRYKVQRGTVAVDPVLGRIAFPETTSLKKGVTVSYHYGFSADMGGGEYARTLRAPPGARLLRVGREKEFTSINAALDTWNTEKLQPRKVLAAVIEIADSGVYTEAIRISLAPGESLQIRAASRARPVLRLLDQVADGSDALSIEGGAASRFTLDGLLVTGRGLRITGPEPREHAEHAERKGHKQDRGVDGCAADDDGDLCDVRIRHCTLVPGWGVHCDCAPRRPTEPSIELIHTRASLTVEHSIIGAISVTANEVDRDPAAVVISDSIVDATAPGQTAIASCDQALAFARVRIARCTVIGKVLAHAVELAENSLFIGELRVGRRQLGCVRFCHIEPGSRTPRRFQCQPDLARQAAGDAEDGELETQRVRPRFTSLRYATPGYCQLHADCADEIRRGADDQSEMGVFHDLYQPQRDANLRTRLHEYSPAAMESGVIYANQES